MSLGTKDKRVPMTPAGYQALLGELKQLKSVERPKNVADIETARAHGDLSENAEYLAAKERQGMIARKIVELEASIANAQVIDPASLKHEKIVFGAKVKLIDLESGDEFCYQIVGAHESNVQAGKISVESPIAKSLIGKGSGDVVRVVRPRGACEFEIVEVIYE